MIKALWSQLSQLLWCSKVQSALPERGRDAKSILHFIMVTILRKTDETQKLYLLNSSSHFLRIHIPPPPGYTYLDFSPLPVNLIQVKEKKKGWNKEQK